MAVFISYAHDNQDPDKDKRVLQLANRLRQDGIDCEIDQYIHGTPKHGWPHWMEEQINNADFVLLIWTKSYREHYDLKTKSGRGKGVAWEGQIIRQLAYESDREGKFIPIVLRNADKKFIAPRHDINTHYDLSTPDGHTQLYRLISSQPSIKKPPLGEIKKLPLETSDETVEVRRETAREEILLFAVQHGNRIQTSLSLTQPFGLALNRAYESEEEILYYIEILKELIADEIFDGTFQRANQTHYLTHKGIRIAANYDKPATSNLALQLKEIHKTALVDSAPDPSAAYKEWSRFKNLICEKVEHLNKELDGAKFRTGSESHSSAGEIDYLDGIFCHFYEKGKLELHFGKTGTNVGNKSPEIVLMPRHTDVNTIGWQDKKGELGTLNSEHLADYCIERLYRIVI